MVLGMDIAPDTPCRTVAPMKTIPRCPDHHDVDPVYDVDTFRCPLCWNVVKTRRP